MPHRLVQWQDAARQRAIGQPRPPIPPRQGKIPQLIESVWHTERGHRVADQIEAARGQPPHLPHKRGTDVNAIDDEADRDASVIKQGGDQARLAGMNRRRGVELVYSL